MRQNPTVFIRTRQVAWHACAVTYISALLALKMPPALPERITHHSDILKTGNESYRFKHSTKGIKLK